MPENKPPKGAEQMLISFGKACRQLESLLEENDSSDKARDAAIHRFEFVFELAWKSLQKVLLKREMLQVGSPKQAFAQAFNLGWIKDEGLWLDMLRSRNLTSHTYDEETAKRVYNRIRDYFPYLKELFSFLEAKARDDSA